MPRRDPGVEVVEIERLHDLRAVAGDFLEEAGLDPADVTKMEQVLRESHDLGEARDELRALARRWEAGTRRERKAGQIARVLATSQSVVRKKGGRS